jgi:hypothetical protein
MAAKRSREEELAISLNAKRAFVGDVAPGREYVEPKIYQQPRHEAPTGGSQVKRAPRRQRRAALPLPLLCSSGRQPERWQPLSHADVC